LSIWSMSVSTSLWRIVSWSDDRTAALSSSLSTVPEPSAS